MIITKKFGSRADNAVFLIGMLILFSFLPRAVLAEMEYNDKCRWPGRCKSSR